MVVVPKEGIEVNYYYTISSKEHAFDKLFVSLWWMVLYWSPD